jgi:hypothetical protein
LSSMTKCITNIIDTNIIILFSHFSKTIFKC